MNKYSYPEYFPESLRRALAAGYYVIDAPDAPDCHAGVPQACPVPSPVQRALRDLSASQTRVQYAAYAVRVKLLQLARSHEVQP